MSKRLNPLISVIVPFYNVSKYIEESVRSLLQQTYTNLEIICINDASEDNSLEIVKTMALCDERIHIISLPKNQGQAYARNQGINAAAGKYVMFLDADDALHHDAVGRAVETIEREHCDIVFYRYYIEYENEELKRMYPPHGSKLPLAIAEEIMSGLAAMCHFYNSAANIWFFTGLYKREFLNSHGISFKNNIIHEDILFFFQAMYLAKTVCLMDCFYYKRFFRIGSTMTKLDVEKSITGMYRVYQAMLEMYLKECPPAYSESTARMIASLGTGIYGSAVSFCACPDALDIRMDNEKDQRAFQVLQAFIRGSRCKRLSMGEVEFIKSYPEIVIYGAGKIAKDTIKYLDLMGVERFHVAVTNIASQKYLLGNKVNNIDELVVDKNRCLILLALSSSYHEEVVRKLHCLGYVHVFSMI